MQQVEVEESGELSGSEQQVVVMVVAVDEGVRQLAVAEARQLPQRGVSMRSQDPGFVRMLGAESAKEIVERREVYGVGRSSSQILPKPGR